MINSIIPKFVFDEEDINYLKEQGIQIQEGLQTINKYKVPCYKFYNLNETEVFDLLDENCILNESSNTEIDRTNFASRVVSVLFLQIRKVTAIKDKDLKSAAAVSLLAAVNSLAALNTNYARRFLPLVRSLS